MSSFDFCSDTERKSWFITLLVFAILFSIIVTLNVVLTVRFRIKNPDFLLRDQIPRYIMIACIAIKTILLFLQAFCYKNLEISSKIRTAVISFGGYAINIAYLSILYSWCNAFKDAIGGKMQKFFGITKLFIIGASIVSIIQYFVSLFITNQSFRYFFSILWDLILIVLFVGMAIILRVKLDIKCSIKLNSEHIIYILCSIASIALITRAICYFVFISWYAKDQKAQPDCERRQMVNICVKESIGQFLPLFTIVLSDLLIHYEKRTDITSVEMIEAFQVI